jgi:catechol 2,3-dioxygenase-like lactoylglutathione lyase family enzyme
MDETSTARAHTARLLLGDECLDVTQYRAPEGKPFFADSRANDRWFQHIAIEVTDMFAAYARLREAHVALVSGSPQTLPEWNTAAAGTSALYFRDPDGHYLELIHFPPGKGQPKWQVPSAALFRGIDHTAIAVADTQQSLHFYQDQLHFHKTGASENYGVEQEHLSGVFNAHVLITSLRATSGIGIELLEYLTPATGRPIPTDLRPEDLACWKTPIEVEATESAPAMRWIKLPPNADAWTAAAWVQDPDGHRIELVKR